MKKIVLSCIIGLLLSSCAPNIYYQVYKVQPVNDSNSLIYGDENCDVSYDFWGEGGSVRFLFYNKSDKNIYVDIKECFFIRNGIAYDYFLNREITSSSSVSSYSSVSSSNSISQSSMYTNSATSSYSTMASTANSVAVSGYNLAGFRQTNSRSTGIGASKTTSTSTSKAIASSKTTTSSETVGSSKSLSLGVNVKEKDIVCIPPKSAKVVSEYNINKVLYGDSNLFLFPSKDNQIKTSSFSEKSSPIVFSNRISYVIEETDNTIKMEHKFYVSEISNYPQIFFSVSEISKIHEDGQLSVRKTSSVKKVHYTTLNTSSDKFYITYHD